jgi:SAM-dependent methyltransferase
MMPPMIDLAKFARYYDLEYRDFADDLALYTSLAKRQGSPVLELACGTGRILASLAREGFEVYGVDISPEMLEVAKARAEKEGLAGRIHLLQGDISDPPIPAGIKFGLAFAAINSFQYLLDVRWQVQALEAVGRLLADEGLLVLDMANPFTAFVGVEAGELIHQATFLDQDRTVLKLVSRQADLGRQLEHVTCIYDETAPGGETRRTIVPFTLRHLFRYEAILLLEKAGFTTERVYGSYDLDEYDSSSERMIVFARRVRVA